MRSLTDIHDEYDFLDGDDRYRLLIDLGRELEPMPDALKTDATLVRGCSASVWVYPVPQPDGRLHFLADSNAAITKGIVALRGWRDWIQLKREELVSAHSPLANDPGVPHAGSRIEIADLKERLRKLEAIAAGVDL